MDNEILELTRKLYRLVEKEAKKEKHLTHGEPRVFTEFLKDLKFYLDEFEEE